jgi:uncharacterized protein
MQKISETAHDMISGMTPTLIAGDFVFATTQDTDLAAALIPQAIATFKEAEGLSLILPLDVARSHTLPIDDPMRCITLNVFSSLTGVGLTAAVSAALGAQNIACNMVAAHHHDHVFVPASASTQAMDILTALQDQAKHP